MNNRELDKMCIDALRATKKMGHDTCMECKFQLLAVSKSSSVAVKDFVQEFFKIADESRPLLIEMKGA